MKAIFFYIFAAFAWVISLLPLELLYVFSYPLYFVFHFFPGYRKELVLKNLRNSFPSKNDNEIRKIARRYYMHLADMFIEGTKLRHMSSAELGKRFRLKNPELLNMYFAKGQDAIAAFGHYGNWEWITATHLAIDYRMLTVYKPLHNRYFDNYFLRVRSRHGMDIIPMSSILRKIIEFRRNNTRTITGLVADQTPPKGEIQYWTSFLNQDTPVYLGVEKLATKFNMAVFFFKIRQVKRGYYEVEAELLTDNPSELEEHELTEMHTRKLEEIIIEKPEFWLWSHRRWKHKKSNNN